VDLTVPTALVLGSEGSGVRPLVRKTCDHVARIPMAGQVGSLNVAAAGTVALYEVLRPTPASGYACPLTRFPLERSTRR